jgi:hypothetical protein
MAFSFGLLSTINGNVSTVAFIITIIFLVLFDSATNAVEASLKGSVIYNSMLQKIYKELMMMGFVSFTVAMYQVSYFQIKKNANDHQHVCDVLLYISVCVSICVCVGQLFHSQ